MKKIITKIKPYLTLKLAIGTIVGLVGGYAYYHFIGCQSGSCPMTSNPVSSVVWGGLLGFLFAFPSKPQNNENV